MIIYVNSKFKPRKKSKKRALNPAPPRTKPLTVSNQFNPVASGLVIRETPHYPSLTTESSGSRTKPNHTPADNCQATKRQFYTGDRLIGIGTLHKSNGVPLFRQEDLEDQAKMRR